MGQTDLLNPFRRCIMAANMFPRFKVPGQTWKLGRHSSSCNFCGVCSRKFSTRYAFEWHMNNHRECRVCEKLLESLPAFSLATVEILDDDICEGCKEQERRAFALARGVQEASGRPEVDEEDFYELDTEDDEMSEEESDFTDESDFCDEEEDMDEEVHAEEVEEEEEEEEEEGEEEEDIEEQEEEEDIEEQEEEEDVEEEEEEEDLEEEEEEDLEEEEEDLEEEEEDENQYLSLFIRKK